MSLLPVAPASLSPAMRWFGSQRSLVVSGLVVIVLSTIAVARRHHLEVRNDYRRYILLSTFGFYAGGVLNVQVSNFRVGDGMENNLFGLSLDKTMSDAMNPYLDAHQDKCILTEPVTAQSNGPIVFFKMDLKQNVVNVSCSNDWQNIHLYKDSSGVPALRSKRQSLVSMSDAKFVYMQRRRRRSQPNDNLDQDMVSGKSAAKICSKLTLSLDVKEGEDTFKYYSFKFAIYVATKQEEGLYNLYFHSCPNYAPSTLYELNFNVDIEERNSGNYLSAGEMPLPALYFMMAVLFFLSGLFWVFILRKSKQPVFKIHYLMGVLVFLKSLSLLFHSINYHYIEVQGEHVEAWAILFYITYLLKGAVLIITIVLIGTGWTFIKHILADKDKKLFMIIIPLQVLANVAEIIMAESDEGDKEYGTWSDIFVLVDLLCCGAILFPVVWSIRHLQEAAGTDGKAAINLRKLKLFRQFYIMIVCYIYFTRIIVILLKITVAFQYAWLDEMFKEMATYVFFVLTGYKFRPVSQHPYFSVHGGDDFDDEDDHDDDAVEILTHSGLSEGIGKVTNRSQPLSVSVTTATLVDSHVDAEERENLISKRESSHEYD
ncbi:lung seven transmembrane receptor [Anopheles darlingi]|uniref:Lung seven transmembrane receptor n=2 Tax=Anopheles darlingi TaxID=43151 RepID=W5JKB8_ANODA|nr:protein GPR107 isoform X1 [Anopheles darlingi]ETN64571.1 lung seven transmembrane receptor [Anopheles darlingi]